MEAVAWDLDSSVCRTTHRRHLLPEIRAGRATWDDYSVLCAGDEPIEGAVALMRLLAEMAPQVRHIAISARSERARDLTLGWFALHDVPVDRLFLRPDGVDIPNGEWKVSRLRQLREEGVRVRLFVEDWGKTAAYIREQTGIPVLGVNPFDPGSVLVTAVQLAGQLEAELSTDQESAAKLAASIFSRLGGPY